MIKPAIRKTLSLTLPIMALLPTAGCLEGGLLITPVTTRRALVEQELIRESLFAADKIALIDVSGILLNGHEPKLIGSGEHSVSLFMEQLDRARRDGAVKAVILRINSPGGTVVASELMHEELSHFRKSTGKPVIALMMDVAASGGYYIACACDEIVAQKSTVTGSIGVIMQLFSLSGTMEMIGVTSEAITSGPRKDAGSPFRKMKPEERALFQVMVEDMFKRFVQVVDEGRPDLDADQVRKLADGRVYTAGQALENGLIDRIASMRETIAQVKTRIEAKKIRLVTYKRPLSYRPNYYAYAPQPSSPNVNLINVDLPSWLNRSAPMFMYLWAPGR